MTWVYGGLEQQRPDCCRKRDSFLATIATLPALMVSGASNIAQCSCVAHWTFAHLAKCEAVKKILKIQKNG
jgi:hypothetical protein